MNADVVSFWGWNQNSKRFVLRAETGWHDNSLINSAHYKEHEGIIGQEGMGNTALYIDDTANYRQRM